jgi:hypothetical protein
VTEPAPTTPTPQPSPGAPTPSPSPSPAPADGSSPTPTTQSRPEYVPETFWDEATASVKPEFTAHIGELAALKAQHEARLAARPESVDGYKLEFPEGYTPPVAVKFDPTDPRVSLLQAFAHKNNWSQAEFSEALTIEAANVAANAKAESDYREAEMKKLGTNGTARVTAIQTSLTASVGEQGAKRLLSLIETAEDVAIFEKLQAAMSSGGASTYNNNGREPAPKPEVPFAQKLWPKRQVA